VGFSGLPLTTLPSEATYVLRTWHTRYVAYTIEDYPTGKELVGVESKRGLLVINSLQAIVRMIRLGPIHARASITLAFLFAYPHAITGKTYFRNISAWIFKIAGKRVEPV
jgi:hypothetical protein